MKTCNGIGKRFVLAMIAGCAISTAALAQDAIDREDHVLSDGKLDDKDLAAVVAVAQRHLREMTDQVVNQAGDELEEAGIFRPMAFMVMKSDKVQQMRLEEEAEQAPGNVKVLMYRAGLKAIARRGEIHAAVIAYPGSVEKNGETIRAMALEHEHRLGVSGIKLIPVRLEDGEASFGEPMSQDKPFQIFYDAKKESDE
ncbi:MULTISPECIES: hypothetical protein [Marinobacter]|jgi:hypothetical protein|uniref:Uncharacterized protein n=2 Tax=Gammaproteobacteria TaxID=1236 RepID=W5YVK0_9GAMM|nr:MULTISPECIES: hypothetical protein [Marinobacter]AHI33090.1 hypothetical protein AU15_07435 [Marinobacter salarius]KXJ47981.1 MAG: hypothetical protein AXW11_07160 [Marinobacter sp. Hex_13]MAB52132.1 hypothetical protein [Marinobacter sp.]MBL85022.1 hypothetical protein [Marinobacter sp.]MBS8233140.1 hypothetical protein [Marinobacter salarius]|tara:strand:- start:1231 stop:1824 length:594 start_codon:yes stop_codon:yes gene_type:complete